MFTIEKLSSHHDRRDFDCGVEDLNSYLRRHSSQHERKGIGRTYVATKDDDAHVVGYYLQRLIDGQRHEADRHAVRTALNTSVLVTGERAVAIRWQRFRR